MRAKNKSGKLGSRSRTKSANTHLLLGRIALLHSQAFQRMLLQLRHSQGPFRNAHRRPADKRTGRRPPCPLAQAPPAVAVAGNRTPQRGSRAKR